VTQNLRSAILARDRWLRQRPAVGLEPHVTGRAFLPYPLAFASAASHVGRGQRTRRSCL